MNARSVIADMLWFGYGYSLPESPGRITNLILKELDSNGLQITQKILDDNPNGMHGRESNYNRQGLD
jgi:hypothetical protein